MSFPLRLDHENVVFGADVCTVRSLGGVHELVGRVTLEVTGVVAVECKCLCSGIELKEFGKDIRFGAFC